MTARELIEDYGYEDVIIYDNPSYDDAFVGVTNDNRAVYDYDKMIEWLIEKEGMDYEDIYQTNCLCAAGSYHAARQRGCGGGRG